jgi:hypothetical protein
MHISGFIDPNPVHGAHMDLEIRLPYQRILTYLVSLHSSSVSYSYSAAASGTESYAMSQAKVLVGNNNFVR